MSDKLDNLVDNFDEISNQAEQDADDAVSDEISSATRMTKEEVKQLFPNRSGQKKLAELMQIVKSADSQNQKKNAIIARAEEFSGVVVKLLGKFV